MLFVSVSARPYLPEPGGFSVQRLRLGRYHVTLGTDDASRVGTEKPPIVSISASPIGGLAVKGSRFSSGIALDPKMGQLSLHREVGSGIPLYYYFAPSGEFFCSSHITMLRQAGVPLEEDSACIPEFLIYCLVMPPRTLFRNILTLAAGSRLSITIGDSGCRITGTESSVPGVLGGGNAGHSGVQKVLDLLKASVGDVFASDAHAAILLSGGLDSTVLTSVALKVAGVPATYSTSFPFERPENDTEKRYALSAASAIGVNHRYYRPTTVDYLHGIIDTVAICEQPVCHLQTVLLHLLFKNKLPPESKTVICGYGADGVFGSRFHRRMASAQRAIATRTALGNPCILAFLRCLHSITGRGGRLADLAGDVRRLRRPLTNPDHPLWDFTKRGDTAWVRARHPIGAGALISNRLAAIQAFRDGPLADTITAMAIFGDDGVLMPLEHLVAGVIDSDAIRSTRSQKEPMAMVRWHLLNYAIWKRLYINGESAGKLHGELEEHLQKSPCGK